MSTHLTAEFKGECLGVRLEQRGPDDLHICIQILVEDDENWFESSGSFSSFWLDDLETQLKYAKQWMENNCDPDIVDGRNWGWKFRG